MESGLMMTIEQLRNKLKSIDDSFEVEEIKETHVEFTKTFVAHQKDAGDIVEKPVVGVTLKALEVVSNFFEEWGK